MQKYYKFVWLFFLTGLMVFSQNFGPAPLPCETEETCLCRIPNFEKNSNAKIVMVSAYEGLKNPTRYVPENTREYHRIDVAVKKKDRPVYLVLSSYESVEWRVGRLKGVKLKGVFASSFAGVSVVTGVPASVPVITHGNDLPNTGCLSRGIKPLGHYGEVSKKVLSNTNLFQALGRGPNKYIYKYKLDRAVVGKGKYPKKKELRYSEARGPVFERDPRLILSGEKGLQQLQQRGIITKVGPSQIHEWVEQFELFHDEPLKFSYYHYYSRAYVVNEETDLPAGLAGAHSTLFIFPSGVTPPERPPGHSTFFVTDGYDCVSSICRYMQYGITH